MVEKEDVTDRPSDEGWRRSGCQLLGKLVGLGEKYIEFITKRGLDRIPVFASLMMVGWFAIKNAIFSGAKQVFGHVPKI